MPLTGGILETIVPYLAVVGPSSLLLGLIYRAIKKKIESMNSEHRGVVTHRLDVVDKLATERFNTMQILQTDISGNVKDTNKKIDDMLKKNHADEITNLNALHNANMELVRHEIRLEFLENDRFLRNKETKKIEDKVEANRQEDLMQRAENLQDIKEERDN